MNDTHFRGGGTYVRIVCGSHQRGGLPASAGTWKVAAGTGYCVRAWGGLAKPSGCACWRVTTRMGATSADMERPAVDLWNGVATKLIGRW